MVLDSSSLISSSCYIVFVSGFLLSSDLGLPRSQFLGLGIGETCLSCDTVANRHILTYILGLKWANSNDRYVVCETNQFDSSRCHGLENHQGHYCRHCQSTHSRHESSITKPQKGVCARRRAQRNSPTASWAEMPLAQQGVPATVRANTTSSSWNTGHSTTEFDYSAKVPFYAVSELTTEMQKANSRYGMLLWEESFDLCRIFLGVSVTTRCRQGVLSETTKLGEKRKRQIH